MGISPWKVGQTAPAMVIALATDSSNADLSGITANNISISVLDADSGSSTVSTGTITITQANPGIISWQMTSGDVATSGKKTIQIDVTFDNGTQPFFTDWYISS